MSVHRRARQLIFALIFLAIIGGGVFLFYFFRTQPPTATCFDNIKNGAEEGPDCGGDCISCLEKYPRPLEGAVIQKITGANGVDVVAQVKNPNEIMSAPSFKYTFDFTDKDGRVVVSRSGYSFLAAGNNFLLMEAGIQAPPDAQMYLRFDDIEWQKTGKLGAPPLSVKIDKFGVPQTEEFGVFAVEGKLMNESLARLDKIVITVLLYDQNGQIIGFNKTEMSNLSPFENRNFRIIWFSPVQGTVSRVGSQVNVALKYYLSQ